MKISRVFRFVLSYVAVGVAAAALVIAFMPDLTQQERPVVQLRTAESHPVAVNPGARMGVVSYAAAVERAAPAVVNIYSSKRVAQQNSPLYDDPVFRRFFGEGAGGRARERVETSLGSGVIVSSEGYMLTNRHVIQGADQIKAMLTDGRTVEAEVIGMDPDTDLAVLKLQITDPPVITLGDSDAIRVGDVAMAIGNPFGVGQTVTQGIVSATERSQLGLSTFENFIQTDAAINPGNSGGALINAYGELIGINTAIFSRSGGSHGIGFAIPVRLARGVLQNIVEHGRVIRGWIGVEVQRLSPELAESFGLRDARGVLVAGILRGGPADLGGLRPGDVILDIDDSHVEDPQSLLRLVTERSPGTRLALRGWRNGSAFEAQVEVSERPRE